MNVEKLADEMIGNVRVPGIPQALFRDVVISLLRAGASVALDELDNKIRVIPEGMDVRPLVLHMILKSMEELDTSNR